MGHLSSRAGRLLELHALQGPGRQHVDLANRIFWASCCRKPLQDALDSKPFKKLGAREKTARLVDPSVLPSLFTEPRHQSSITAIS